MASAASGPDWRVWRLFCCLLRPLSRSLYSLTTVQFTVAPHLLVVQRDKIFLSHARDKESALDDVHRKQSAFVHNGTVTGQVKVFPFNFGVMILLVPDNVLCYTLFVRWTASDICLEASMKEKQDSTAQGLYKRFDFRTIRQEEADEAAEMEAVCFPPNEACSRKHMVERVRTAAELFLVAVDRETGRLAGFLNGISTNETSFRDAFFTDAALYNPDGKTVMLLGLDVLPAYRRQGLAGELVRNYCRREQKKGRKELILTCHDSKVAMYQRLGFRDLGKSASNWGGQEWHEMVMILNSKRTTSL